MKKIIYPALVMLFLLPVQAGISTMRIGIMPFQVVDSGKGKNLRSSAIASELSNALKKFSFIKLVERSRMTSLVREIEAGQTGLIDEATAIKAGKLQGLQVMIFGTMRGEKITARAVFAETGVVIAASSVKGLDNLDSLGEDLADGIESYIARHNLKNLRNNSPRIDLEMWVQRNGPKGEKYRPGSKNKIQVGDTVAFFFKANTDGYLTVVDIQPGGDVVVLFPNDLHPSNKIKKGQTYSVPSEEDEFEITVSDPPGTDTLVAYFTRKKVRWLNPSLLSGKGLKSVKKNRKHAMSRGFSITATKLKKNDWETVTLEMEVVK